MSDIEFQDVFDPYYVGRKNPMPHEQAAKDKDDANQHQLAERTKRSKKLKTAAAAAKHLNLHR